jgi:hypothetical protein
VTVSPSVRRIGKIAVTLVLVAALLYALDTRKLADAIFRIDPAWTAIGVALCFLFAATRMAKWVILARGNGLYAPVSVMVRSMLFALALGIVTPGRVGELVAIMPLPAGRRSEAVLAYLYDRIGELNTVLLLCVPAALAFLPGWGLPVALILITGTASVVAAMESRRLRLWLVVRLPRWIPQRVGEILGAPIHAPARYWGVCFACYLLTYAAAAAFMVGAKPIGSLRAVLVLPVVTLSNLVTVTIGGLGVREGLAALVSPVAGLTPEITAAAFFLLFFWTRLVPGLAGLAWVLVSGHGFAPTAARPSLRGEDRGEDHVAAPHLGEDPVAREDRPRAAAPQRDDIVRLR